jgi:hypothetical protein
MATHAEESMRPASAGDALHSASMLVPSILFGLALGACAGPERFARATPGLDEIAAELDVIARFAEAQGSQCREGLTIERRAEKSRVIYTEPAILEIPWRLHVCGTELNFTLDCIEFPSGVECDPHEWPAVVRLPSPFMFAVQLELAVAEAGTIPCSPSACVGSCEWLPLVIRRTRGGPQSLNKHHKVEEHFEVERCGTKRQVDVSCDTASRCQVLGKADRQ